MIQNDLPNPSPQVIEVGCELSYQVNFPTSILLQVAVAQSEQQRVMSESLLVNPYYPVQEYSSGSMANRTHKLVAEAGPMLIQYRASVVLEPQLMQQQSIQEIPHSQLPPEVLPFLNPSRYCESDRLIKFSHDEFGYADPGYARVQQITDWVHRHLEYVPGSTGSTDTACDVLLKRAGVCRDYAHLAIAFCRAVGIPARYVSGYALDLQPPDFHGFFEAYLKNGWNLFDATKLAPVSGFVRIGVGMDAAEVSFASFVGDMFGTDMRVWAHTAYLEPAGNQ
ncbi:MAG: transglutaminase family protein [Granulosicoccus sp.]